VTTTPIDVPMVFGRDAADAAAFLLGTEPVRALLEGADSAAMAAARDALAATLVCYQTPDGVQPRGAHWLVSATRPMHPAQPLLREERESR